MTAAGTTSDLYMEKDNPNSLLGSAPAPPTDVPMPVRVQQPVVTKTRMADERPDGSVRDTSTEALRPGNDLDYRNLDEPAPKETPPPDPPKEAAAPAPAPETKPAPPPEPPKMYAGKFKTTEDLERGYEEAQKLISKLGQQKAEFERQAVTQAATPPKPVEQTPEQIASKQARAQQILNEFVADPEAYMGKYYQEATQRTQVALSAQQVAHEWRSQNPDLVDHEFYVSAEAYRLTQSDPELAKDPAALINKATDNFRAIAGKIRSEGAKEALTQETRVIPLASNSPAPPSSTEQPGKAPLTFDDAFDAHMKMMKQQEQRSHRGLRR